MSTSLEKYVADIVQRYVDPLESILEIGCNGGKNLDALYQDGYRNFHGIELVEHTASVFALHHPDAFNSTHLKIGAAEDILPQYPAKSFGCVLTVNVLGQEVNDVGMVTVNMIRVAKPGGFIITVEDESIQDYREIFDGSQMFFEYTPTELGSPSSKFVTRVFRV